MLNMDMIGRMKDSALVVEGIGTSPVFEGILRKENVDPSIVLKLKQDGYGPSDHASFYSKEMPVLFFFTNLHDDYHRPSDTWDKINYAGVQKIVTLVSKVAQNIASTPERPAFTKVAAPAVSNERRDVRVSLGVVPDYAEDIAGLKISGTRPGSAAEKAGLKAEDVIIKFGKKEIKNIYDFTAVLGEFKPGDEVIIVVKRGTEEVSLKAILQGRQ
jgi:membrane-associated protease RseP (regulator of RpoE activity)